MLIALPQGISQAPHQEKEYCVEPRGKFHSNSSPRCDYSDTGYGRQLGVRVKAPDRLIKNLLYSQVKKSVLFWSSKKHV